MILAKYEQHEILFTEDGWFNATDVARRFGKEPYEWLRLPETMAYIAALQKRYEPGKSRFVKTARGGAGGGGGTWLHPKLGVPFARWLDVDFSIWCDEQIEQLLRGTHKHYDWKRLRHEATASYKVLSMILQRTREKLGKTCEPHHFSNEARMVNWALTGTFGAIDRNLLSHDDLDLLAKLETLDSVLIGSDSTYADRKVQLQQYADQHRKSDNLLDKVP